ncbi:hypothetical protein ACFVS2_25815 [Brevibacillus sp. NPDC058079]|uniref:hypothetical protein n=1 Tax=Brevibacillus sp. NPDC058079 TaxID=3346330 RepID=UPI0036EB0F62
MNKFKKAASLVRFVSVGLTVGGELGETIRVITKQKTEELKAKHETKMLEERIKHTELRKKLQQLEGEDGFTPHRSNGTTEKDGTVERREYASLPNRMLK